MQACYVVTCVWAEEIVSCYKELFQHGSEDVNLFICRLSGAVKRETLSLNGEEPIFAVVENA